MTASWLGAHLEAIGLTDTDGYTIRPRAGHCRQCHHPVIRALDDTICGLPVTLDPQPLNAHGELWARQQQRATYTLTRRGDQLRIDRRDARHITSHPPQRPGRRYDVLTAHQCYAPPLDPLTTTPATTHAATAIRPVDPPY